MVTIVFGGFFSNSTGRMSFWIIKNGDYMANKPAQHTCIWGIFKIAEKTKTGNSIFVKESASFKEVELIFKVI